MPSHLRLQTTFEPFSAETVRTTYPRSAPPQKKQKMSLTQTYYIASSARTKLGQEASRADHDLRLLVGHANLLDSLMLELHDAEREQEAWFNQTVRTASSAEEPQHIQWADTIDEEDEEDDSASETSESDDDSDFEEDFELSIPLRKLRSPPVTITTTEVEEDDFYDEEDDEEHALTRTPSNQPPELVHDSDESDDESPPTTPPQATFEFSEKERQAITTSLFDGKIPESEQDSFLQDGFFIPERNSAPLIAVA